MQSDDFLVRFLTIFEEVATTMRASADSISRIADVDVTTPEMVRYLGEWVTAPALDSRLPLPVQRNIVHATGASLGQRGTKQALRAVLEAVTDGSVEVLDNGGVFREDEAPPGPGQVTVRATSLGHLRENEFVDLVVAAVPANVAVRIEVEGRTLHPVVERGVRP